MIINIYTFILAHQSVGVRNSAHTPGNGDTTQQPARDSEGELAAAAAAAPPPPPPLLLLLLLCCYCPAAASRPAMHREHKTVTTDCCFSFCVFRNARRSEIYIYIYILSISVLTIVVMPAVTSSMTASTLLRAHTTCFFSPRFCTERQRALRKIGLTFTGK